MSLVGKNALICNSSSSLGYAIARKLGLAGAQIFLTDPDETGLNYAIDGLKGIEVNASGFAVDLSSKLDRTNLFKKLNDKVEKLDVAVLSNKPNIIKGSIIDATTDEFDQIFFKYLTVPFLVCKSAVPLLRKSNSIAGYTPFVDIGLYSAVQTGVLGLCKALSKDLIKQNIRVNSVCLGMFDDDGSGAVWSSCSGKKIDSSMTNEMANKIRTNIASFIPIGRTGNGNDCAGLIEFLASDKSSYITGENITVAGGVCVKI